MKIRPMHDRVAVKRSAPEKTSKGGIIIPQTAQAAAEMTEGTVLAIGQGRLLRDGQIMPLTLKVGEKVLVAKYGGQVVRVEDEEIVMLHEDEVLAVIDP